MAESAVLDEAIRQAIRVTGRGKGFFPERGETTPDLIGYYQTPRDRTRQVLSSFLPRNLSPRPYRSEPNSQPRL